MRATAKIRRYKLDNGQTSFRFSIVSNYRDPVSGRPRNRTLEYLGSIRDSDIPRQAPKFHAELDAALDRLKGKIYGNCAGDIRRKFEAIVPRPKVTTASPSKDILAKLAERGYKV